MTRITNSRNVPPQSEPAEVKPSDPGFSITPLNGSPDPRVKWEGPDFDAMQAGRKGEMDLQASLLRQTLEEIKVKDKDTK